MCLVVEEFNTKASFYFDYHLKQMFQSEESLLSSALCVSQQTFTFLRKGKSLLSKHVFIH